MKKWILKINISTLGLVFASVAVAQMNKSANLGLGTMQSPTSIQIDKMKASKNVEFKSLNLRVNKGKPLLKGQIKLSEGGIHGGGGTSLSLEFAYFGSKALMILADEKVLSKSKANKVSKRTFVFDVENICMQDLNRGQINCLDAQYFKNTKRIEFDRDRWTQKTCEEKFSLSAHEYLRAAGLEDSDYQLSKLFFGGLSNKNAILVDKICTALQRKNNKQRLLVAPNQVDFIITKNMTLPYGLEIVLRSYLNNHCYFSLSVADAILETAETKSISIVPIVGYADGVHKLTITLNLKFGSDDTIFEEEQTIILENTSGEYQIAQSEGVCSSRIRND